MKIFLTIMLITGLCVQADAQIAEPIHLSFNLNKGCNAKKIIKENGKLLFHLGDQFFKYIPQEKNFMQYANIELKNIKIIDLQCFLIMAKKERQNLIREKYLTILPNNEVFNKIYLYERIGKNLINRYTVTWSSMIE